MTELPEDFAKLELPEELEDAILDLDREGDVPNCGVTEYYAAEGGQLALVHANFISPELAEAPTTASSDQPAGAK